MSSSDSESERESDGQLPNLSTLRSSVKIQRQVDNRLREPELLQCDSGNELKGRIKSKRGGPVKVKKIVKKKVVWPHEAILGGANQTRVTYDQLSLSQWVQGFCPNIIDEQYNDRQERMISYMSDLMEDATDFSWQNAKAAHAEHGTVSWEDTEQIDPIQCVHAQKHTVSNAKGWTKADNFKKPWFCRFYQNGTCQFSMDHEVAGKMHRHICAACLQQGHVLGYPEKNCIMVKSRSNAKKTRIWLLIESNE